MKYNINALKDGLNYSDYFSDEIPGDVKPVYSLTPVEEENDYIGNDDIPTQSKDLFKGLCEDILNNHRDYWMDSKGRLLNTKEKGHIPWAMEYINAHHIKYDRLTDSAEIYNLMFELKFIRIKVNNNMVYVDYEREIPPSSLQWRNLKDSAIESNMKLIDDGGGIRSRKEIELFESKYVNKDSRSLFIESMMPDNMDVFKSHLVQLFAYLQKELQLKTVPSVKLISDEKNADKVLGKTAYYNPDEKLVVLYITNRHQKDILRSFAHEIIHYWQHENEKLQEGESKKGGTGDPQYAQNNPWLRQMEKQAYLLGNMLFRDWEDQKKAEDKKSGTDGKGGRVNKKVKETTYSLGNEYPPKKMDYRG